MFYVSGRRSLFGKEASSCMFAVSVNLTSTLRPLSIQSVCFVCTSEPGCGPLRLDHPAAVRPVRGSDLAAHRREQLMCPGSSHRSGDHTGLAVTEDGPRPVGTQLRVTRTCSLLYPNIVPAVPVSESQTVVVCLVH